MLCFPAVFFVAAIVTTALSSIWVMGNDGSCKCNSNVAMLNLAGLALGLAILETIIIIIYFVYILLVLEYFMKELTL